MCLRTNWFVFRTRLVRLGRMKRLHGTHGTANQNGASNYFGSQHGSFRCSQSHRNHIVTSARHIGHVRCRSSHLIRQVVPNRCLQGSSVSSSSLVPQMSHSPTDFGALVGSNKPHCCITSRLVGSYSNDNAIMDRMLVPPTASSTMPTMPFARKTCLSISSDSPFDQTRTFSRTMALITSVDDWSCALDICVIVRAAMTLTMPPQSGDEVTLDICHADIECTI